MARPWLLVALVASLGANVFLLVARSSSRSSPSPNVGDIADERAAPLAAQTQARSATGGASCERQLRECSVTTQAYRAEVQKLEQAAERARPMEERFERGQPNEAARARLSPAVKRFLEQAGANFDIECRGDVCSIDVITRAGQEDLTERLQRDPEIRKLASGLRFESPTPTNDPVSKQPMWREKVMVAIKQGEDAADGKALLDQAYQRFLDSGALARCYSESADRGVLEIRMDIEDDGSILVSAGGDLGAKPAGRCLVSALERAAAEISKPSNVRGAVVFRAAELPPT